MTSRCPSEATLSRAFTAHERSEETEIHLHVESCDACRRIWAGLEQLGRIGKQLPVRSDAPEKVELLRSRVLAAASADVRPATKSARWIPAAIAASVIALVIADRGWERFDREPVRELAIVRGSEHAVFVHRIEHQRGAELVELSDGRLDLDVPPLEPERRFLVVTADGEVEVRGTSFRVTADRGRLMSVEVITGVVEVRPRGEAAVLLAAGDRWSRTGEQPEPEAIAAPPPDPPRIERRPLEPRPIARVEPTIDPKINPKIDPIETAFLEGWQRFKAGEYDAAADSFARASRDPSDPVAEEAEYWRAIALARGGHTEEAASAMRAFTERRPGSTRTREMSLMLGRITTSSSSHSVRR